MSQAAPDLYVVYVGARVYTFETRESADEEAAMYEPRPRVAHYVDSTRLEALERDAARYQVLRAKGVLVDSGDQNDWYDGDGLDAWCDIGMSARAAIAEKL